MSLTSLYIDNCKVQDLSPLRGMPLSDFRCGNTKVSNLSPLQGMPLTRLECHHTTVADLSPLEGMPLRFLLLAFSLVTDLSPLRGMPLEYLNVSETLISDLSPLQGMPLKELHFNNTPVYDLSPLQGMPLTILHASKTQVERWEPLREMKMVQIWASAPNASLVETALTWPANAQLSLLTPATLADHWARWQAHQQAHPQTAGLQAQMFQDKEFKQLVHTQPAPWVGWHWGHGAPLFQLPYDNFSLLYSGFLTAPSAGDYILRCWADDTATLTVDGKQLSQGSNSTSTIRLTGQPQPITIRYQEGSGQAGLFLYWTPPGGNEELIPPEAYTHEAQ